MTQAERNAEARGKINNLKDYFTGADLPVGPVNLYPGTTITDVKTFVAINVSRLANDNLHSQVLRSAYAHLMAFKTIIENGKTGST